LLVSGAVEDGLPRILLRDLVIAAEHVPLAVPPTYLAQEHARVTEAARGHTCIVVHLAVGYR